jgi:hypothetical protein
MDEPTPGIGGKKGGTYRKRLGRMDAPTPGRREGGSYCRQPYVPTPGRSEKGTYTVKKVSGFPVPSRDVTDQTLPGRELLNFSRPRKV